MPVHTLTVLLDGGTARRIRMADVRGIRIVDERLRDDLDTALSVALSAAREHTRSFTIHTRGEGERRLEVSYLVEAPVWKATYRLLLADEGRPQIQGWAVVDNTTDEDWADIGLSLISGLPVSFTHDLYTPRYVPRPEVAATEQQSIAPPVVDQSWAALDADLTAPAYAMEAAAPAPMAAAGAAMPARMMRSAKSRQAAVSSVEPQATTRAIGDLFGYDVDEPVTIGAHRSALVPIVLAPFDGQRVLLYNPRTREENPVSAVEMTNTTGLTLEGGPVTVLDGDTYAGEAMIEPVRDGETRLVPYAVELGVRADATSRRRHDASHRMVLSRGVMTTTSWEIHSATYRFSDTTGAARTLVLEHPHRGGEWAVTADVEPAEETPTVSRFRIQVAAQGVTTFEVTDRREQSTTVALSSLGDDILSGFAASGRLDGEARGTLEQVVRERQRLADLQRQVASTRDERADLVAGQDRIRQNLAALGSSSQEQEYRADLVGRLRAQEADLDRLDARLRELEAEEHQVAARVDDLLAGLEATFDVPVQG